MCSVSCPLDQASPGRSSENRQDAATSDMEEHDTSGAGRRTSSNGRTVLKCERRFCPTRHCAGRTCTTDGKLVA